MRTNVRTCVQRLGIGWAAVAASCGSSSSDDGHPVASFTLTTSGTDAPLTVFVDASASIDADGIITSYGWDFADGTTATGIAAAHTYQGPGSFEIELRVTDDDGHEDRARRVVLASAAPVHYVGVYASSLFDPTDVALVLDTDGSNVSGSLRDSTGRTGVVSGAKSGTHFTFEVQLTTPSCDGTWSGDGTFTADGLEFTFFGSDCAGAHLGFGETLRNAGEVLAIGEHGATELVANGGEVFWSSDSPEPLKRYTPASGALGGLAPRVGPILGVAADGADALWTELIGESAEGCGSANAVLALRRTSNGTTLETLDTATNCSRDATSDLVIAAGAVYWAQQSMVSPNAFTIRRTPLDGAAASVLVTTARRVAALAADDTSLYWSEEGDVALDPSLVRRVPLAGGAPEDLYSTFARPLSIAVTANDVIIATRGWATESGELVGVSKSDGSDVVLATFASPARRVVTDGTSIAWLTDAEVGILEPEPDGAQALAQTIAPGVDVVIDGDRLVWVESSPLCCGGSLRAVSVHGGAVQELAATTSPLRLARAGDGSLSWSEGGIDPAADPALMRWTPALGAHTRVGGLQRSSSLAVDESDAYCVQGFWIKRVPRSGGTPERFSRGDFYIADVALDAEFVYWVEPPLGTVRRRAKTGGPIETISIGNGPPSALVVAAGQVLWIEGPDTIRSADVSGGRAAVFASAIGFPTHLVTDGEYAYFNAQDAGAVQRRPLDGGPIEFVGDFGAGSLSTLAVDASSLFAIDQTELARFRKSGGAAPPSIPVHNDVFSAGSVTSEGQYVYWSETLLGSVGRRYVGPLEAGGQLH